MAAAPAHMLGLSPGYKFQPADDELVRFFLIPRLHGLPLPIHGLIIDDDPRRAPPWTLLGKNGRGNDDEAFFFAPGEVSKNGRQARTCAGGGTWVTQKLEATGELFVRDGAGDGETLVEWTKNRLNFHLGSKRSGSTGWVMHEYTVGGGALKICHIAFTGHGQKRSRVPDGYADQTTPAEFVDAAPAPSCSWTSTSICHGGEARDQEFFLDQPACKKRRMLHDEPVAMLPGETEHYPGESVLTSASDGGVSGQESTHPNDQLLCGQEFLDPALQDMFDQFQFDDKEPQPAAIVHTEAEHSEAEEFGQTWASDSKHSVALSEQASMAATQHDPLLGDGQFSEPVEQGYSFDEFWDSLPLSDLVSFPAPANADASNFWESDPCQHPVAQSPLAS